MIRKLFFVLSCFTVGIAFANPQLVMSQQDPAVLKARISQLNEMRNNNQFSDAERERLDALWQDASTIEIMNDRCGTISITEQIDESCGHFYQYELPKFEAAFFKLTGEIRLSPNRLSNAIEQRRQAINQCYEALQIEAFYPTRYFTLEGNYTPEPLSRGVEVSYNFSLTEKDDAIKELNDRIRQWHSVCGHIIHHSDNSGALAPIFTELVRQSRSEAPNVNGGLYFELEQGYGKRLLVKTAKGIEGVYYLNGRELFNYKINGGSQIFAINLDGRRASASLIQGEHWRDRVVFDDNDLENGLMGRFVWSESRNTWSSDKPAKSSVSAPAAQYQSYGNDDWNEPRSVRSQPVSSSSSTSFNINFQLFVGLNLAFGQADEASELYKKEGYSSYGGEHDSVFAITGYLDGIVAFEFSRNFAIGIGGGIAWNNISYERCRSQIDTNCDEEDLYSTIAPMFTAELNFGDGLNWGPRISYVFDTDFPTLYLGAFAELGNLIGLELGWVNTEGLWNNIYLGITARFPPRHFSENLKNATSNK